MALTCMLRISYSYEKHKRMRNYMFVQLFFIYFKKLPLHDLCIKQVVISNILI